MQCCGREALLGLLTPKRSLGACTGGIVTPFSWHVLHMSQLKGVMQHVKRHTFFKLQLRGCCAAACATHHLVCMVPCLHGMLPCLRGLHCRRRPASGTANPRGGNNPYLSPEGHNILDIRFYEQLKLVGEDAPVSVCLCELVLYHGACKRMLSLAA